MDIAPRKIFKSKEKWSYSESESESKPLDHAKNNSIEPKSCEVSSMMLLSEDLMIDIISRVSLKCLLNSARYVCKSWATIIGSSHFVEVYQRRLSSKPGLYVESLNSKTSSYFLEDDFNDHVERIELGMPPEMGHLISDVLKFLLLPMQDDQL